MKKFLKVASVLLLLASFIGCDQTTLPGDNPTTTKTGQIEGVAQFENKTNHEGINITLVATSGLLEANYCVSRGIEFAARAIEAVDTTTDEKGNYKFENVEPGTYTIYASADASSEKAVLTKVEVRAGETAAPAVLKLNPTGNIQGLVTIDGKTEGVLGCEVFIGGTNYSAKVASSGAFVISDVPVLAEDAPIYELYVQKGDYIQPIPYEGKVEADKTLDVGKIDLLSSKWSEYLVDCTNQISRCEATEEGIKFVGTLLSNGSSNSTSQCIIQVTNIDTGVVMSKNYSVLDSTWEEWNFVYPLVEKDKEYKFRVQMYWNSSTICAKEFTVTAIGGLGEYIVENADEVKILFDKDSKIISRTEQKFTDNKNIPILEYGTLYTLYSNSDNATSFWDGEWLIESAISKLTRDQKYDLTKIYEISGWRQYEYLERALQGRQLGVKTVTYAKLAKYDYNGTATFYFNDQKIEFFDWDDLKSKKAFIMYGISLQKDENTTYIHLFKDIPGVEEKYILETENGLEFVEKDTPNAMTVYGKVFDYGTTIPVPAYIPDFSEVPLDDVYKKALSFYKFTGEWIGRTEYSDYVLPFYSPNLINNDNAKLIDNLYVPILMFAQMEQYRAIAEFCDAEGKTLLEPIECKKGSRGISCTLPAVPEKEGFIGYWTDEDGRSYNVNSTITIGVLNKKFYAAYRELIFSENDLYYLDPYSSEDFYIDVKAGTQYKIVFADRLDGKDELDNLIAKQSTPISKLCDVRVTMYDTNGYSVFYNRDNGYNSPYIYNANEDGKIHIRIEPWSSEDYGYFALKVE